MTMHTMKSFVFLRTSQEREDYDMREGTITRGVSPAGKLFVFLVALVWLWALSGGVHPAYAQCVATCPTGSTCATYMTWPVGADSTIMGFNPHSTEDDVGGLTSQV